MPGRTEIRLGSSDWVISVVKDPADTQQTALTRKPHELSLLISPFSSFEGQMGCTRLPTLSYALMMKAIPLIKINVI